MTKNQIEYQKLLETKRANAAAEALTRRRDEGTLALREAEISETGRHNLAYELETSTHNRNVEAETSRHNFQVEAQGWQDLGIKGRQAAVAERNATVNERNATTNESQAAARWYDVATSRMAQHEGQRHNLALEGIQAEGNRIGAYNASTNRIQASNSATANRIKQQEADIKQQEADISARKADASIAFDLARTETEQARRENLEKETHYMGQENARNWIGTIGNQIHNFRQDNIRTRENALKAIPAMTSLLGG